MNKKFEYVDDNPGSYFGMLIESVENKKDTKKKKINESAKYEYLEKELAEVSNDKDIERAYDENELTIVKLGNVYYMEHCPDELIKKVKTLMKKYYPNLVYLYDIDLMDYSSQNESLKEDKFVPQDKMSKKAQKELNDKKRGTWGSTNPVTRVQPNKKAYDRKRDKKVVDESKKLNESSDGWDESKLDELSEILDEIYNLQYEVKNTVRGAYTNAHTYEELGYYVRNLGSNLMDVGDEIMEMEEEEEDDEDED